MKKGFLLTVLSAMIFLIVDAQTVTIDIQESGGGCTLATDCETNTACFDLLITVNQSNWQLASYNIWTEYPSPPVMSYANDNACLTQNGGDTDNNTQGQYRVSGINGISVLPVNTPTVFHTICYSYSDELEIRDSLIASGGTLTLYDFPFYSTITLVKATTGQTVGITINYQEFLTLNSSSLTCLISEISVEKVFVSNADNDGSGNVSLGDVLTYSATATNLGYVRQENVVISDPLLTPSTLTCPDLEKDESCVLTGTYVVTQDDVDAGFVHNVASVTTNDLGPVTDEVIVPVPQNPELIINKALLTDISGGIELGDGLVYEITATNTGNITLHNVMVSDPKISPVNTLCASLAPGATCTLTGVHVVTQADINVGQIVNTGSADSDETNPVTKQIITPIPQYPELSVVKTLLTDISGGVVPGDVLFYTVNAVNIGNTTLNNVVVTDPKLTPSTKTCVSLAPFTVCSLTGFYIVKQSDLNAGMIANTGNADSDETPPVSHQLISILPQQPELTLTKTLITDVSGGIEVGDVLEFLITGSNTGNISLSNVTISDPMLTPDQNSCSVVSPLGNCILSGTYVVTQGDIDNGIIVNTATGDSDQTSPVQDQVSIPILQTPGLKTFKTLITPVAISINAGSILRYQVTANNTGNTTLHNVQIFDPMLTPDSHGCSTLLPGASCVLEGEYNLTQSDIDFGKVINTGLSHSDETTPDYATVTTNLPQNPGLNVVKSASEDYYFLTGDIIHYTISVQNTGNVTIDNIVITDPNADPGSVLCNGTTLIPGQSFTCTATHTIVQDDINAGSVINVATASGTDPLSGAVIQNSNPVQVGYGGPLPEINAGPDDSFCEDGVYTLSNASASNYSSILWESSGDGTFSSTSALNPVYTPGVGDLLAGMVTLAVHAYPISPAVFIDTDEIALTISRLPVAVAGTDVTLCEDQNSVSLSGFAQHNCGISWSSSGDGNFDNSLIGNTVYNFGINDKSAGLVELCMTAFACSPCSVSDQSCFTVTFDRLPVAFAGDDQSICGNQQAQLNASAQFSSSVMWDYAAPGEADGSFSTLDILNPEYTPGPGDILRGYANLAFTAGAISPCLVSSTDYVLITVYTHPEVSAGSDGTVCEDGSYILSGATAIHYSSLLWTGNVDNPTILNPTYTPTPSDIAAGLAELCLTAQPLSPCMVSSTACITIFIQNLPTTFAGDDFNVCEGDDISLTGALVENSSAIQWIIIAGAGSFSNETIQNPVYYPNPSIDYLLGCVTLQVVSIGIDPCTALMSDQIEICFDKPATVDAGVDATLCENSPFTANPAIANGGSVMWNTSGDGTFDNPNLPAATYFPGTGDAATFVTLTITVNSTGSCMLPAQDDVVIYFEPQPQVFAGNDATVCEMVLAPSLSNGYYEITDALISNSCDFFWSSSGDGNFNDMLIINPVYTLGNADIMLGQVDLCLTAVPCSPCLTSFSDCLTLSVSNLPAADAGADLTICGNQQASLDGSAWEYNSVYWDFANLGEGDGAFSNQIILNPDYTPGTGDIARGYVNLLLTAFPNSSCLISDSDVVRVTVNKQPDVFAGNNAAVCKGESYALSGATAADYSGLDWSGGTGIFVPSNQTLNPTYTPGVAETGTINLCLTAQPLSPCTVASTDCLELTIQEIPVVNAGADITLVFDQGYVTNPSLSGTYASLLWTHNGSGSFDTPDQHVAAYTPGINDEGQVVTLTLTVFPGGACATPVASSFEITYNPSPIIANDDTGLPVTGASGGTVVASVLINDELNGALVNPSDVVLSQVSSTNPGISLDPVTGAVNVAPGTPSGTYYLVYQICEIAFPTNCDQATVTVVVVDAAIIANDDTGTPVNGMSGGVAVNNVLDNDLLDGNPVDPADVTLTFISSTMPGITLDPITGGVFVSPGIPAGTYYLVYEICEILNPANCDQATVTVEVTAAPIVAADDTGTPVSGINGGVAVDNVLDNDLLNGLPVNPGDVTLTQISTTCTGVSLNPLTGEVVVAPGTPEGICELVYEICEILNPANCDQATVTIEVTPATLAANDDTGIPVNGMVGGEALANVLTNDLLNGSPVNQADIILSFVSSTSMGVTLNETTGAVHVAPGTPAGTYYLVYEICEVINPGNCDQATVTIAVIAPEIIADDDNVGAVTIAGGINLLNVFDNDLLNGLALNPSDVTLSVFTPDPTGVLVLNMDGSIDVAPNSMAGIYQLTYQICEITNPSNCDQAIVTAEVLPSLIVDSVSSFCHLDAPYLYFELVPQNFTSTGPVTITWLDDNHDVILVQNYPSLSGSVLFPGAEIDANGYGIDWPGWLLINGEWVQGDDGFQGVRPVASIEFTVNPTVAAIVDYPPATSDCAPFPNFPVATDDFGMLDNGISGMINILNVLDNDVIGGSTIQPSWAIITTVIPDPENYITLNPDGSVDVAPGTPEGNYTLTYSVCLVQNPNNCDDAVVIITIGTAEIEAIDDNGTPVNGFTGGQSVASVLTNDLLNGMPVNSAAVVLTQISTTNPGVTLDVLTGSVNVAPGTFLGTYYVVYQICEVLNPVNCDQATVTVPVLEPPVPEFCFNGQPITQGSAFNYCEGDPLTISVCGIQSGVPPLNICWEINGIPDCANGIGLNDAIFNGTLPPGNYNVHVTSVVDANGLLAPDVSVYQFTIEITNQPFAYAGINAVICSGENYYLFDAVAEYYNSFIWTGGDGYFMPDNQFMKPVYVPGTNDLSNGVTELCLIAQPQNPCTIQATDCMMLSIQGAPLVDAGDDATICENDIYLTNATAASYTTVFWNTSGDGFFYDENELETIYQPGYDDFNNGYVELCLNATSSACTITTSDCMILTFDRNAAAFAGIDATICAGDSYIIGDAQASDFSSVTWMSTGDGQFIPSASALNPEYIPGPGDVAAGFAELCLTALPSGYCSTASTNCMVLSVVPQPVVSLPAGIALDCSNYDFNVKQWQPINVCGVANNAASFLWTTSGDGTFVDETNACTEYILGLHDSWDGEVTLTLTAFGGGSCSFVAQDNITLFIPIQLIDHDIDAWWGLSSYVDKTSTSVPEVMFPITGPPPGSSNLVIMVDKAGKYYWPEGVPPVNQLGSLQPIGYKIKMKNTPSCLPIFGDTLANQSFVINGPFTYVPVLTNVETNISTLFAGHLNDILLIFEFETSNLWTPVAWDFTTLKPGRAYLLVNRKSNLNYTIQFPDYDPYLPITDKSGLKDEVKLISPWNEVRNTAVPHALIFAEEALSYLQEGDVVGVFNSFGQCTGISGFNGRSDFFKLIAMGKDPVNESEFGFDEGEIMNFKLYRAETGETFDLTVSYDDSYPSFDGKYSVYGLSRITAVSLNITNVNDLQTGTLIKVFPNPATEAINIQATSIMKYIRLVDNIGQVVYDQSVNSENHHIGVDHLPAGIYFVHVLTANGENFTRMIAVK